MHEFTWLKALETALMSSYSVFDAFIHEPFMCMQQIALKPGNILLASKPVYYSCNLNANTDLGTWYKQVCRI